MKIELQITQLFSNPPVLKIPIRPIITVALPNALTVLLSKRLILCLIDVWCLFLSFQISNRLTAVMNIPDQVG